MKKFALMGAAGFVAERHLRAIKETGGSLVVTSDPFDVMGRIDSYFPFAEFFKNTDKFWNFVKNNEELDYASICTPNYLHAEQIEKALKSNLNVICEKPLVLYPSDVEQLRRTEKETGKQIFSILQLRLHPAIKALKNKIENDLSDHIYDIDLSYITSRGKWYDKSWKSDVKKSGGVATNIGIHFFDMLIWIFGDVQKNVIHMSRHNKASGFLQLEKANVRWFLSLDYDDIPAQSKAKGARTHRSVTINEKEIEFSEGFTNLHTKSYENILSGNGFDIDEAEKSIFLTHEIRNGSQSPLLDDYHPFLKKYI